MDTLQKHAKLGILVLILVAVAYLVYVQKKKEGLIGGGVDSVVFTSGANQRRLGQEFSQPGQGEQNTVYLPEMRTMLPGGLGHGDSETLVSGRGEPDFWQINRTLDDYKFSQAAPMRAEAKAAKEGFGNPIEEAENALLAQSLYH
jgi:hypothetical protein